MTGMYVKAGQHYHYNGATFLILKQIGNDLLQVEELYTGEQQTVSLQWLLEAYARAELCFERPPLQARTYSDRLERPEECIPDFTSVPEGARDEAEQRYHIMQRVKQLSPEQRNRKGFQALAQELKAITSETQPPVGQKQHQTPGQAMSASSIERWWRDYVASGEDIRVLIPGLSGRGGKGRKHTAPEVEALIAERFEFYALHPKKRSLEEIMDDLHAWFDEMNKYREPEQQVKLPSKSTISRRIQEAGVLLSVRGRRNRSKAKQKDSSYPVSKPMRILQVVEIEHIRLPFLLVDEEVELPIGVPILTAAIDGHSGSILGISVGFEPPNEAAIQNCLLHAILPKKDTRGLFGTQHEWVAYGIPKLVVMDQNPNLLGTSLKDACKQLDITLVQLPGRFPWLKAQVIRFFRNKIKQLGVQISGSVSKFSSIIGEPFDPQEHPCISAASFWRILYFFLVDEYPHKWQESVQGVPYLLWMEDVRAGHVPALPWSANEARDLLRSTSGTRRIGRNGIEFEMLYYASPELAALKSALQESASHGAILTGTNKVDGGKPCDEAFVAVRYDPGDLSAIYVRNPLHDEEIWLRVPAVDQEYAQGLTLWKHRVIRKYLTLKQTAVDSASLQTAKEAIQKVVDQEFQLSSQSTGKRKKVVRYNGTGIQPTRGTEVLTETSSSLSALLLNTTSSISTFPDEPKSVVIGNLSTDSAPTADQTNNLDIQQPVSTSARKPQKIAQRKTSGSRTPPTFEP